MTREISSFEQLRSVDRQLGMASILGRIPHFRFVIAGLSETGNREANERMSNYQSECGCFAGGLVMGAFVLAFTALFVASGRSPSGGGFQGIVLFLAFLVCSTLVGKMLGLLWARVQMVRLIKTMAARGDRGAIAPPA